MKGKYYILIAGVGGQGNILASRVLATAAIIEGYSVRIGETYGASQRGGSVVSHVKIGKDVFSPLIPKGYADVILGLEPLEALRIAYNFGNPDTVIISNVKPVPSGIPLDSYPNVDSILKELSSLSHKVYVVNATEQVIKTVGTARALNIFMLGCLCGLEVIPLTQKSFEEAIRSVVPPKYVDLNIKAFREGVEAIRKLAMR